MEVGGLLMLAEEEAQKLLQEVNPPFPNTSMIFQLSFLCFVLHLCV